MMACFYRNKECVVVVSNFTKTLDMLSSLCHSLGLRVMRLDGQTPLSTRRKIVEQFNESREPENVLLLSTKAGGLGLNLIGASRLILFDLNWNPAVDMQAMARIWRHGQEKTCHIYRLVTAGTIDEKILQRQLKKTGLTSIINPNERHVEATFLNDELNSIFTVTEAQCETHDVLGCQCDGRGSLTHETDHDTAIGKNILVCISYVSNHEVYSMNRHNNKLRRRKRVLDSA
ncbi:helicase protein [Dictyocaulus viviparus]|uniref:DNA repair and recombination protein RAD54-like n=1 Tax=Dictyocaulus viviparus TaxID=29172 RepID=A0A0D8XF62_DICVI|nr:helicase protein [Dictyocaulus viviparus]